MTHLNECELTPLERAAIADEPRPGVWVQTAIKDARGPGDGRVLTQVLTDNLIGLELLEPRGLPGKVFEELQAAVGRVRLLKMERYDTSDINERIACQQRRGIHSDPLVRLLAFRAWGDRDRAWRKRDTARALTGDVLESGGVDCLRRAYGFDGISQFGALFTAQRDDRQTTGSINERDLLRGHRPVIDHMLDLFDELDAKFEAGGDPRADGPSFVVTS